MLDSSPFLLLLGRLFLFHFIFINTDCGDCHTAGIRVAVLDYFQIGYKETKSYLVVILFVCSI